MKEYLNILKKVKLFEGISENDLVSMLSCMGARVLSYQKGEFIISPNGKIKSIGIILNGNIEIVKEDLFGRRTIVTCLGVCDIFGEVLAFSNSENISLYAISTINSNILFIDYEKIITTCQTSCKFHSRLIYNMLYILASKNLILNKKIDYLVIRGMRDKLIAYFSYLYRLNKSLEFKIPFSKTGLSEYLSVDRSAMVRELSRMQNEGLIAFDKNNFKILDINKFY